ncbi:hypothetical protein AB0O91_12195 [Kitasatospora sp. NPDC089797]|uniref:hypothetical protein n=1 Tax=Kitasatospora sp. NPDC089797 TaxID=3155298 RepID=UPI0034218184
MTSTDRRHRRLAAVVLLPALALPLAGCGAHRAVQSGAAGPATPGGTDTPGASPYVEPGAGDGAPHYRENNGYRIPREMSAASAQDARREADRIEPVLQRLWKAGTWDPQSVRTALLGLGYPAAPTGPDSGHPVGTLLVWPMAPRFETDHYVTPEGTRIGLRVHDDACVTAFTQASDYQVSTNGPYPETGCFEPARGH